MQPNVLAHPALAPEGRRKIDWVRRNMPILRQIEQRFAAERPFAGLRITVHAGEADGPHSVWSAVNDLGAERIGHGIASVHDGRLTDMLAERAIGLEVCLTSNVHTSIVAGYASHPIRQLFERGIAVCLNTDDPGISGIDLPHEYDVAAPQAGLDAGVIRQLQENALDMAFLSDAEKKELRRLAARKKK